MSDEFRVAVVKLKKAGEKFITSPETGANIVKSYDKAEMEVKPLSEVETTDDE